MKKTLLALSLGIFSLTAQANWYVQGDLGVSNIRISGSDYDLGNDTVSDQRISVGYDWGNWRGAVDYTNFGTVTINDTVGNATYGVDLKIKSLGVTGFYDFKTASNFTPYVGVRVAYNKADLKGYANSTYYSYSASISDSESRIGIGALGGVQYKFTDNFSLNAGIEANLIASDVTQFGAKIGLRYTF